jgi:putative Holliday junction resolvase
MKYLGVDYGTKKIGISKSNESGTIAFPVSIIAPDTKNTHIDTILDMCKQEEITNIVIGHSIDFDGKDNAIEKDIAMFIEKLLQADSTLAIHRFDERMSTSGAQAVLRHSFQKKTGEKHTSAHAKKVRAHTKDDDAKVAAYILQGFLDMQGRV